MPTVNVVCKTLFSLIGKEFTDKEFEDLCFDFGIELEEVTSEKELALKTKTTGTSDEKIYKIDIPANRYDMLCVEGIARALKTYLQLQSPPVYTLTKPEKLEKMHVELVEQRPFVVAAILRNVTLDQEKYDSFIELQDKLHNNICRKRTLVAIGTHDLDTIKGPFTYKEQAPSELSFVPLNQTTKMNGNQLVEFYETDRKLSKFLPIIRDQPKYPIIYDSNNVVLSLPPIINGDHSKIKLSTKNIFIECTATDETKANIVLNTVVTMFSEYCLKKFTVEPVEVVYKTKTIITPKLEMRTMTASVDYINSTVGIKETAESLCSLVQRMSLFAKLSDDKKELVIQVPPTRSDVLHACDVMEDAAVAYNFNKIKWTSPKCSTVGAQFPINKLSDQVRKEIAFAGYTEVLSFALCSHDENFKYLKKKDEGQAVRLENPKTVEYQVVRTSLLPGILKTVSANKHAPLPIKLFEVSDVVFVDETFERRARNQRNIAALICNKQSGFEQIHGLVDRLMTMLNVSNYSIKESSGRRADIFHDGKKIGYFGIIHPQVLQDFEIDLPCSALEMNLEPFL